MKYNLQGYSFNAISRLLRQVHPQSRHDDSSSDVGSLPVDSSQADEPLRRFYGMSAACRVGVSSGRVGGDLCFALRFSCYTNNYNSSFRS